MRKVDTVYLKLLVSAFFWGISVTAGKLLLNEVSPAWATFLRFSVAAIMLLIITKLVEKDIRIGAKEHLKLFILGLIGVTLCYYFYFTGLYHSSAFNTALIEATIPLVTLLISVVIKKERFHLMQFVGFIIAYIGILVIISNLNISTLLAMNFSFGDILLLLGTLCFGIYNVLYRNFSFSISPSLQTSFIFLYGAVGLIPWLLYDINKGSGIVLLNLSLNAIGSVLVLSLGSSVVAYLFFNEGIKTVGASKASGFINLVPIISIVFTISILKEQPTLAQFIGATIVLIGVFLSQKEFKVKEILKPTENLELVTHQEQIQKPLDKYI